MNALVQEMLPGLDTLLSHVDRDQQMEGAAQSVDKSMGKRIVSRAAAEPWRSGYKTRLGGMGFDIGVLALGHMPQEEFLEHHLMVFDVLAKGPGRIDDPKSAPTAVARLRVQ